MPGVTKQEEISGIMPQLFLTYATDVIQERAIPRLEDGLKPVQRRILYAMYKNGNFNSKKTIKSAKTVGAVIGTYHPHGDASVYDAMVFMAQPFSLRYPLITFKGNSGNIQGDPAAHYRYTEAKLSTFGELLLEDIDKETVDMQDNYDNTTKEPVALGGYFPNALVNPTMGIAVGIATTFAPHYLKDIIEAACTMIGHMIKDEDTDIEELISIVKAPDFPTGGTIVNASDIPNIYRTGHGRITLRGKYRIEQKKNTKQIVFYELPYKISYTSMMEGLIKLSDSIPDIKDIRDESSKEVKIVIELKRDANPDWIIRQIFKRTELQSNFNCNCVAIDDQNKPRENVTLKDMFEAYITRAAKTLYRSMTFDKKKYEARLERIAALLFASEHIDEITKIIKTSDDPVTDMTKKLSLSVNKAKIIYEMKLSSISKISNTSLKEEQKDLEQKLETIVNILSDQKAFLKELRKKIQSIPKLKMFKDDARRTDFMDIDLTVDDRSLIKDQQVSLTYTNHDIIKSVLVSDYTATKGTSKGVSTKLKDDEVILDMLTMSTKDDLFCFTNTGRVHFLPVYKIPIVGRNNNGKYLSTLLRLDTGEHVVHIMSAKPEDLKDKSLVFVTKKGIIKRLAIEDLSKRGNVSRCMTFKEGDTLASVLLCKQHTNIILISNISKAIRIDIDDEKKPIRPTGKTSMGVNGMSLEDDEYVVSAVVVDDMKHFLTVSEQGMVKKMTFDMIPLRGRGAKGVKLQDTKKAPILIAAMQASENQQLMIVTKNGKVSRTSVSKFMVHGRTSRGTHGIKLSDGDIVVSADITSEEE
jgi:DNA gyrase subunit A